MTTFTRDNPTIIREQVFEIVTCCSCQIEFGLPRSLHGNAKRDPSIWFHCPHGHRQHYTESEADRLRKEIERERNWRQWEQGRADAAIHEAARNDRRRRAEKAAKTRLKNRIAKGVCPCCNRSFVDVHRHIASQHPDFSAEVTKETPDA